MKSRQSTASTTSFGFSQYSSRHQALAPIWSTGEAFSLIRSARRFILGMRNLLVALRYKVYLFRAESSQFMRRTSVRLAILGFIFFLFFSRDVHLDLRLPTRFRIDGSTSDGLDRTPLSLAQPMGVFGKNQLYRSANAGQLEDGQVLAYIDRFDQVARLEMKRFGIPASILMAQALSESWAGTHKAAVAYHNHFGKPLSEKVYGSAWENWRAHSVLIAREYPALLQLGVDHKAWAKGLQRAGYSDDWGYARKLRRIIDKFQLAKLDK